MDKIRLIILATAVALAGAFNAQAVSTSDYVINEGTPSGDLNGDDNVNVGDVSELYKAIVNGSTNSKYDLNSDGSVNVGDVSELYGMIISGSSGSSGNQGSVIVMNDLIDCRLTNYLESDYRHQWTDGDVIYLAVDGDDNSTCTNVYAMVRSGGKWVLQDVMNSSKAGFKTSGGRVDAVYVQNGDVANSYYDYIPISGEVAVCNTPGSYTVEIKNNKFYITLKNITLYQFASRIDVYAANEGDYFYGNVRHLDALTKVRWLPKYGYASFMTTNRAPVVNIDPSTHKGVAYGVWEKGTRVSGWLTLNYAKSNGYCYFWNYGTENLTQGRYLTSVYSPWQNGWTRDLSMRFVNYDDSYNTVRVNAGASTETVRLNVGTNIILRAYNGDSSDTQGQILSATTSTSGIIDVSVSQPEQVNVIAHKAGTTTLTVKHKTKDKITATYTFNVIVEPTLWIAGSIYENGTTKPMLWRNHQSKAMYLGDRSNYTAATKIMVHGNNAAVMMRKDVFSPKTFYTTSPTTGETYDYDRYYFTGTSAGIYKATGANGGGYFNQYTTGITGAHHLLNEYLPIYGVPRMWTDKSGNVYYTSAVRTTSSDVIGQNTGSDVNTTIYKNKTAIVTVPNFVASDIAVSESTGKIYVVGYTSNISKIVSKLVVINGSAVYIYNAESSAKYYYLAFTRLFFDQNSETAYIEYMAGNLGTLGGNYHTCIYRYTESSGLQLYSDVNTQCTTNYPFMQNSRTWAGAVIKDLVQYPFTLYGNKFYFLRYGNREAQSGPIRYYQLGASDIADYTALDYDAAAPALFEIKNGWIGAVMYDKTSHYYYPMCAQLNAYKGGTRLENDNNATIYDIYMQTSLDD